jgi:hypothetical protein
MEPIQGLLRRSAGFAGFLTEAARRATPSKAASIRHTPSLDGWLLGRALRRI